MGEFKCRLLIVEDEPLLRVSMADALREEGWVVDIAPDGKKGVALFERRLHDVVVTDMVMPGLGHGTCSSGSRPCVPRPTS